MTAKKSPRRRKAGGGRKPSPLDVRHQIRHKPGEWDEWESHALALGFAGAASWLRQLAINAIQASKAIP